MPLQSMTGFGAARLRIGEDSYRLEVVTVNNRHLEVRVHLPEALLALEGPIARQVKQTLSRGRVDVFVRAEGRNAAANAVQIDRTLAARYLDALKNLAAELGLEPTCTLLDVANLEGVMSLTAAGSTLEQVGPPLAQALATALRELLGTRQTEGAALQKDMVGRLDLLASLAKSIETRTPEVRQQFRQRLQQRIAELSAGRDSQWATFRLENEIVLLSDRLDITEELVRIATHLTAFRAALEGADACGRRLEFLSQELNREFNTIGSKCQDGQVAGWVVDAKVEVERLREQVLNVE